MTNIATNDNRSEVGKDYEFDVDIRHFQNSSDDAIRDVYDAIVEYVTNCDDSYHELFKDKKNKRKFDGGPIWIRYDHRNRTVTIQDRAAGFDHVGMDAKIKKAATRTSGDDSRGRFGVGMKYPSILGTVTVESIKDGKYTSCIMKNAKGYKTLASEQEPTPEQVKRLNLEIDEGISNGTCVTIALKANKNNDPKYRLPRFNNFIETIRTLVPLRPMCSKDSETKLFVLDADGKQTRIIYRPPEAKQILGGKSRKYDIPNYDWRGRTQVATLSLFKSETPLSNLDARTRESGLLITSGRIVCESSFLDDVIDRDEYSRYYYGTLDAPHIFELFNDYDNNRDNPKADNQGTILDQSRLKGLEKSHPFVQKLSEFVKSIIGPMIENDRKRDESKNKGTLSKNTKKGLDEASKIANKFLSGEDIAGILGIGPDSGNGDKPFWDTDDFKNLGIMISPAYTSVNIGENRSFVVVVKESAISSNRKFNVSCGSSGVLHFPSRVISLEDFPDNHLLPLEKRKFQGKFVAAGRKVCSDAVISAKMQHGDLSAQAMIDVTDPIKGKKLSSYIEFEKEEYTTRHNSDRRITLFSEKAGSAKIWSDNPDKVGVTGQTCVLNTVPGESYAVAAVQIKGRTVNASTEIYAELNGHAASCAVYVIPPPKNKDDGGSDQNVKFDITDNDYDAEEAVWVSEDGSVNVEQGSRLLIGAKHPTLSPYLGESKDNWPGQGTREGRQALAMVITNKLIEKAMIINADILGIPEKNSVAVLHLKKWEGQKKRILFQLIRRAFEG